MQNNTTSKYLIFQYQYQGHYLEYIRHLLNYASVNIPDIEIHLVLHPGFEKHVKNNEIPIVSFCHFHYFNDIDLEKFNSTGKLSRLKSSYYLCKKLSELIHEYDIDKTILITSVQFILGLGFLTPLNSHISAIEYIIPRRRIDCASKYKKIEDCLRMWLYAKTPQLKQLFLLNDEESVAFYNKKYHSSKFKFLPDPIDKFEFEINKPIANDNKIILLHAGCFRKEKGTFDIIDALKKLDTDELSKFKFILCGKSIIEEDNEKAKKEMYELKQIMDVEFYNDFVSEKFLHSLYNRANYVLIPYHNYYQSSGNLGHAASYGKPVIGPGQGLLGNLIRRYNLGITLDRIDSDSIADSLRKILGNNLRDYNFKEYLERCSPIVFAKNLFNS